MRMKKTGWLFVLVAALTLVAGSAFAGPVWKFGKDDQGLLKLDYKGQFQVQINDAENAESIREFHFRRNRLAFMGAYGKSFSLYVQTEYNEDNSLSDGDQSKFQMLDAVMRFKLNKHANLWVGKFKYSFTRENLEACEKPLTLDRSLFIRAPFVSTRDNGVSLWGNFLDNKAQLRVDVMNGRTGIDEPASNFRVSTRAHVTLLDPEKNHGYQGTYLGKKKVLTLGAAYQYESNAVMVNTAQGWENDYNGWTVDLFAEYPVEDLGTVTFSSAYVDIDFDDAYKSALAEDAVTGASGERNGAYVKAGYMLPNLPLQFFARYEDWCYAKLGDTFDQDVEQLGLGFNYYLKGQNLKLTAEYSQTDYDQNDAASSDVDTFVGQLQLIF